MINWLKGFFSEPEAPVEDPEIEYINAFAYKVTDAFAAVRSNPRLKPVSVTVCPSILRLLVKHNRIAYNPTKNTLYDVPVLTDEAYSMLTVVVESEEMKQYKYLIIDSLGGQWLTDKVEYFDHYVQFESSTGKQMTVYGNFRVTEQ